MNAPTLRHLPAAGTRRQRAASLKTVLGHRMRGLARRIWSALENTARLHAASELLREASRLQAGNSALADSLRTLATIPTPSHPRADTLARAV
jgi:hypothetical protein